LSAPSTTELYALSLHDALPISVSEVGELHGEAELVLERSAERDHLLEIVLVLAGDAELFSLDGRLHLQLGVLDFGDDLLRLVLRDRKSTRLNSSHVKISYAVFC